MLTPPWHLILPLVYVEVRVFSASDLYFSFGLVILEHCSLKQHFIPSLFYMPSFFRTLSLMYHQSYFKVMKLQRTEEATKNIIRTDISNG